MAALRGQRDGSWVRWLEHRVQGVWVFSRDGVPGGGVHFLAGKLPIESLIESHPGQQWGQRFENCIGKHVCLEAESSDNICACVLIGIFLMMNVYPYNSCVSVIMCEQLFTSFDNIVDYRFLIFQYK